MLTHPARPLFEEVESLLAELATAQSTLIGSLRAIRIEGFRSLQGLEAPTPVPLPDLELPDLELPVLELSDLELPVLELGEPVVPVVPLPTDQPVARTRFAGQGTQPARVPPATLPTGRHNYDFFTELDEKIAEMARLKGNEPLGNANN